MAEVIERVSGRCGELVLRRQGAHLEIIANGVFLVSTANALSSRALVTTALPQVRGDRLRVLMGGLGLGDALDEALASERVAFVTVVELERDVVRWFRTYGGERAARAAAAEAQGRAHIVVNDVARVLRAAVGAYDLVLLDTDNGPGWLVREQNAGLYSAPGVRLAHDALCRGGVACVWSAEPVTPP